MSAWLNHYETRMMLYRDLGIMELDDEGMWIDRPLERGGMARRGNLSAATADPQSLAARSRHRRRCRSRSRCRRARVRAGSTSKSQRVAGDRADVPRAPLQENVPPRAPGEEAAPAGRDRARRQCRQSPPASGSTRQPTPRQPERPPPGTAAIPSRSRLLGRAAARPVADAGGRSNDWNDCSGWPVRPAAADIGRTAAVAGRRP